jgi:Tfp pilus assembly protein PilV
MKRSGNILKSEKGITLAENLAAILVFSVLMLALTTLIAFSLRLTGSYVADANRWQDNANSAVLEPSGGTPGDTVTISGTGINVTIPIIKSDDDFIAFYPTTTGGP